MAIRQRNLDAMHTASVFAPATVSAAANTTAVDLSDFDGDALLVLSAAASAASSSMAVKVQAGDESNGSDAADVEGAVFAPLDDNASVQALKISMDDLPPYVRLVFSDETGTFSAAVSCVAVGIKNRR